MTRAGLPAIPDRLDPRDNGITAMRLALGSRPVRVALAALAAVILIGSAAVTLESADATIRNAGMDFRLYRGFAESWAHGGPLYLPVQLAGPYSIEDAMGNAYPPTLLWLTVPFALGLPAVLWWAVPLALLALAVRSARPSPAGWLLLACLLVYPRTWFAIVLGNPALWAYAAIACGAVWGWPSALAAVKIPLAPFALPGWRTRGWRLTAAVMLALSLPFGMLWIDYARALLNAQSARGLSYTLGDWPVAAVLLLALGPLSRVR